MLKVVDVIGLASTGAYEGDASLVTRTKIVRIAGLGSGALLVVRGATDSNMPPAEPDAGAAAYVRRLLPLTCLAPGIVEAIQGGRQPNRLRLTEVLGNGPWARRMSSEVPGGSRA